MTSALRRSNSAAISLTRSDLPAAQRCSIAIVSPSLQPTSFRRAIKAAVHGRHTAASAPSIPMSRCFPGSCAWVASGHAPTNPQAILMNSRRLMACLPHESHFSAFGTISDCGSGGMPLVTAPPMSEIDQMRTKFDAPCQFDQRPESLQRRPKSQKNLTSNKEADDQRRKSKHAQGAAEYPRQPKGPATVVLDNLRGYIGT